MPRSQDVPERAVYRGIRFLYSDMRNTVQNLKRLADPFLAEDAGSILDQCQVDLDNAQNASTERLQTWQISESLPLRTRVSDGGYRDSEKGGGVSVYGELAFTWQLQNPDKGRQRQRWFHLMGRASTSISIRQSSDEAVVARWQFESGDAESPGCHFHSAVNQYGDRGLFPEWLKVPRFPGLLFCPMDSMEFLIGELFQRDWLRHVSVRSEEKDAWGKSQMNRLGQVLKWQIAEVANWKTTPWMALKKAKPKLEDMTP